MFPTRPCIDKGRETGSKRSALALIALLLLLLATTLCMGFQTPPRLAQCRHGVLTRQYRQVVARRDVSLCLTTDGKEKEASGNNDGDDDVKQAILRGSEQDEFSDDFWQKLEEGQPSEWSIMKELLGVNMFTYILASAIVFFLSMNVIFGQGWLGNSLGIQGTGTFTERSENLPNVVDLSDNQFSI